MQKVVLTVITFLSTIGAQNFACDRPRHPLEDTQFLSDPARVRAMLLRDYNFHEQTITTQDNYRLDCLSNIIPTNNRTMIVLAGFYPGNVEGMAPLLHLVPPGTNLLLVNARGHGKSDGSLLCSLPVYGQHEYQDILAAIQFLYENPETCKKPIYIHGICAGARHAADALCRLTPAEIQEFNIQKLFFDSGWGSVRETSYPAVAGTIQKQVPVLLRPVITLIISLIYYIMNVIWWITGNEKYTKLTHNIAKLPVELVCIHAEHDELCPIARTRELLKRIPPQKLAEIWEPKISGHASVHLKEAEKYRAILEKHMRI